MSLYKYNIIFHPYLNEEGKSWTQRVLFFTFIRQLDEIMSF